MNLIQEFSLECDVLVAGGGLSGVCCALSAARNGAQVILVQDRPVLGGNASSEIRMHVVGADCHGNRGELLSCEAREGGLIEEIRLDLSVNNVQRSPSLFDVLLYDKCRSEKNLRLLLNATLRAVTQEGLRLVEAEVSQETTEKVFRIRAKQFVDCTGDGRLGAEAGADFRMGREAESEFGESMALPVADLHTLGSSLLLTASRRETPTPFRKPAWARHFEAEDLAQRLHLRPGQEASGLGYGFWWLEWGGHLDTIRDNEEIRDELLAIVLGVWDHIKNSGLYPGVEFWALDWVGYVPGKRESRRFLGPHVLTQQDVQEAPAYPDSIAYGGWWIDLHPVGGVDAPSEPPCVQHHIDYIFDVPLRCCFSRNIPNLWMAGRNISATHVAFASTRVMATCALIGEGVGVAVAAAVRHGVDPADIVARPELIGEVQQTLLRQDAFLIGIPNRDPKDLARRAIVSASSEAADGPAANVLSGYTRSVHGKGGAPKGRAVAGTHRWISAPGLPASLELRWKEPIVAREIRVVFDTGQHRELTFSLSEGTNRKILWGAGQPETAKDYQLVGIAPDGTEKELATVEDNYRRLCIHPLPEPTTLSALRLVVTATNGAPEARVLEVRVY
ncbi:MAG: FAD-dependent oxidoreductase [Terrimicrobiaceae bacterium]